MVAGHGGGCYVHGRRCVLKAQPLDLFVAGFSCKSNSMRNGERWTKDPLDLETSCSMQTFTMTVKALVQHRPKWFVLENVPGARQGSCESQVRSRV